MSKSLTERLQEKLQAQTSEIEALTRSELEQLALSMKAVCKDELNGIKSDIHEMRTSLKEGLQEIESQTETTRLSVTQKLAGMRRMPLWTALSFLVMIGLSLAILLTATWWYREALTEVRQAYLLERQALERVQEMTGQVDIRKTEEGTYVMLPRNTDMETIYRCGDRRCLKLP